MRHDQAVAVISLLGFFQGVLLPETASTCTTSALYKYDPVVTAAPAEYPSGGRIIENCVSTTAAAMLTTTAASPSPSAMPGRRLIYHAYFMQNNYTYKRPKLIVY